MSLVIVTLIFWDDLFTFSAQPSFTVHADMLNSRFAYVSISRASHEATLLLTTWQRSAHSLERMCRRARLGKLAKDHPLHEEFVSGSDDLTP